MKQNKLSFESENLQVDYLNFIRQEKYIMIHFMKMIQGGIAKW